MISILHPPAFGKLHRHGVLKQKSLVAKVKGGPDAMQ